MVGGRREMATDISRGKKKQSLKGINLSVLLSLPFKEKETNTNLSNEHEYSLLGCNKIPMNKK